MTYTCEICLAVNANMRFHCRCCGTIPAKYSILHKPTKEWSGQCNMFALVPVVIARGADRVERHHTSRSYLRTVPMDYYATEV